MQQQAKFAFARHETFHLRDGWLCKGLSALQADTTSLYKRDAHHALGIGINMLKSLIYWLQATNLVNARRGPNRTERRLELTPLAELILEKDQYFEDPVTLWLLHIELCNNRDAATFFYWVFNEYPHREFTQARLVKGVHGYIDDHGGKQIAETSLLKDARCFVHTYVDYGEDTVGVQDYDAAECPLSSLGLVRRSALPSYYKIVLGEHPDLSAQLFLYALCRFRDLCRPGDIVLSLDDVKWSPHSPGRTLCLDMHRIVEHIEEIQHRSSDLRFTRTAELNMVSLDRSIRPVDLLRACYSNGARS